MGRSKGFDSLPTTFLRSSQISLQSAPRPPQKARAPTVFPVTPRRKRRSIKPNGFTADAGGRIRNASPTAQTRLRQLGRGKGALSNCFSARNHSPNPVSPKTPKEAGRESKNERRLCLSHRQRSRRSSLPSRAGRLNGPEVGVQRLPAVGLRLERNVRNGDQKTRTVCKAHGLYSPWNYPGQNTGVGSHSLLQWIFPTQGLNPGLPHCRRILYHLSHQGSPELPVPRST